MVATLKPLLMALALGLSAAAHGQGDPTRPPLMPMAAPDAARPPAPAPKPLVLQALRLGAGLAPSALVEGHIVHVGDRLREDMRVLAITAQGVRIGHPDKPDENWLRISPNVKKTQAGHESP